MATQPKQSRMSAKPKSKLADDITELRAAELRRRRIAAGVSQEDLADVLGKSANGKATISKYETGKTGIPNAAYIEMMRYLIPLTPDMGFNSLREMLILDPDASEREITNDRFAPELKKGDHVIIRRAGRVNVSGIYLIQLPGGAPDLYRAERTIGGKVRLQMPDGSWAEAVDSKVAVQGVVAFVYGRVQAL